jgi:hypothetical protein
MKRALDAKVHKARILVLWLADHETLMQMLSR